MKKEDFNFVIGQNFEKTVIVYSDSRVTNWRGEWTKWRVYEPGEAVEYKNKAYVSLLKTRHTTPGEPGTAIFWSPVTPLNLSTYTVTFEVEGVHSYSPTVIGPAGEILILCLASTFTTPPSSAPHYVKIVSGAGAPSYPVVGTALFRKP